MGRRQTSQQVSLAARRVAFTLFSGLKAEQELRTTPPPEIDVVPELQQEPEDAQMAKGEVE